MKKALILLAVGVLMTSVRPGRADQTAEEILESIITVRALVSKDARIAETPGGEREEHSALVDPMGSGSKLF
jgi:hypothetical protein